MAEQEEQLYAKLTYENAVYREQLKLLEREIQRIQLTTTDLMAAAQTCQNLRSEEALVPVGGGTFIRSRVSTTNVLVPVGANYLIEMGSARAVLEINRRTDAARNATTKLQEEYKKIAERLQGMGTQLRDLQQRIAIDRKVEGNIGEDYL